MSGNRHALSVRAVIIDKEATMARKKPGNAAVYRCKSFP